MKSPMVMKSSLRSDEILSKASDEMKSATRRSRISLRSDFIHRDGFILLKGRFRCTSVLRDKNKNPPRKVGFELCQRHNVFISLRTEVHDERP